MEPENLCTVHLLHTDRIHRDDGQTWPRPFGHSGGGQLRMGVHLGRKGALSWLKSILESPGNRCSVAMALKGATEIR